MGYCWASRQLIDSSIDDLDNFFDDFDILSVIIGSNDWTPGIPGSHKKLSTSKCRECYISEREVEAMKKIVKVR